MAKKTTQTGGTPLSTAQKNSLSKLGLNFSSEEEARAHLVNFLHKQELKDIEDEELDNLITFYEAFKPEGENGVEDEDETEEISAAIAREVNHEDAIKREDDEDEDEDEEVIATPTKVVPVPKKAAPISKTAPTKTAAKVSETPKRGPAPVDKFDGRNVKEHAKMLGFLREFFPDGADGFQFDLVKQGVTIRALMQNTRPTVLNFDEVRINPDGTLSGNVYFNKFKSVEELVQELPTDFQECKIGMFRGESHPSIKNLTQDELIQLLRETNILSITLSRVGKLDAKMSESRQKMKESLELPATKSAKPAGKKVVAAPAKKVKK